MRGFRVSRGAAALGVTCCLMVGLNSAQAQLLPATQPEVEAIPDLKVDVIRKGTSSRQVVHDAEQQLPLRELAADKRQAVDEILQNRSMFRRLPTVAIEGDSRVYDHFTANPESAVGIWRVLEISQFQMKQTSPMEWFGDAGDGSSGTIEVLYRSPTQHLLLCSGQYKNPLVATPIKARALMHLRTNSTGEVDGEKRIVHDLDLFVMFPSQAVETVARVISPVSNVIADRNFRELSLFVRFMTVAMQRQPGWVERMTQRIDGISPKQREELLKITARVFVDARRAEEAENIRQTGLEQAVGPFRLPPTPIEGSE
jgi:hypothetical protein